MSLLGIGPEFSLQKNELEDPFIVPFALDVIDCP